MTPDDEKPDYYTWNIVFERKVLVDGDAAVQHVTVHVTEGFDLPDDEVRRRARESLAVADEADWETEWTPPKIDVLTEPEVVAVERLAFKVPF